MMHFHFKPTRAFTLVVLFLLPILISLGFWQLHRAEETRFLQAKFAMRDKIMPITLKQAQKLADASYYPIQLSGYFDNAHSMLLDNQFYQHRLGYQVITPFLNENQQWILVNRGWLPMGASRAILPKIPTVSGNVKLIGFLYAPKKNPFISNKRESTLWPLRIESLDISLISSYLNRTLYPSIVLLDPKSSYGFERSWQPVNMKTSMHIGYAVQWFSMAFVLLIIYIGINLKRKNPREHNV